MAAGQGNINQIMRQGNLIYIKASDGNFYPVEGNTSGQITISPGALIAGTANIGDMDVVTLPQREPFIFRPGATALANGMVLAGSVTGATTILTAGTVVTWSSEMVYAPYRSGKIDGLAASGIVTGQITIGHKSVAGTVAATVSIRGRNTTGASTATTVLLAATAIGNLTTAETFTSWDIPYLFTTANFNQVPFGIELGIATAVAASSCVARVMSSSFLMGEFEPGS